MSESLRIFLVDNDDEHSLLQRAALERAGHQVKNCHTAADALLVLGHGHFHLVLIDQELPDMDGLALLQRLKGESAAPPVLFTTRRGDERLAAQVFRAGALDYVK